MLREKGEHSQVRKATIRQTYLYESIFPGSRLHAERLASLQRPQRYLALCQTLVLF